MIDITDPPRNAEFGLMVCQLGEATRELFAEFGFALGAQEASSQAAEADDDGAAGMAVIGYAGAGLRGALVLTVAERAIDSWMAAIGVPDAEPADTLGEFANMLLGRLKERLLPIGISIIATTPTAAVGRGFRLSDYPQPSSWLSFAGPGWNLRVRLDANFEAGFQLQEGPLAGRAKAGDIIELDESAVEGK